MYDRPEVAGPARPLRILYVITKANWGGAQRYVFDLATAAKRAGHDVLVVSGNSGPLTERLEAAGVASESIGSMQRDIKIRAEIDSFLALRTIVRDFGPDVIHGNSSKAGALAAIIGRIERVPHIVFTAHGWAFNESRPKWQKALIAVFHYLTVLLSHNTIAVSKAIQRDARFMPLVGKRMRVIHNGVSPVSFLSRTEARQALVPEFVRSHPDALWIGVIAELHPTKGLDTLIEAFAKVAREDVPVVLVIMGEGQSYAWLSKLAQVFDLPDRIYLAGFVPDAGRYLPALDIFALPSRTEALGYAFLEAGLAKLPCVGSEVGGIPEVLEHEVTGLLVPSNHSKALATALHTLIHDSALRERLGQALEEKVRTKFSIERMIERTLALYRN
ncbi:MAG TPA: glycosyltransferase [Candidatus Paceibacterota bacterium]